MYFVFIVQMLEALAQLNFSYFFAKVENGALIIFKKSKDRVPIKKEG
jgi:hypothetical protein